MQSLNEGTKLWGAVSEILSKELIISLPHGLRGHVAYKDASDVLSSSSSSTEIASSKKAISKSSSSSSSAQLSDLFHVGQLVRCVVSRLRTGKEEEVNKDATTTKKQDSKTQAQRKRVDITLHVAKVNSGLGGDSVREGAALSACVKSVEDHGYLLTFGIKNTTGFLPKADSPTVLRVGSVVDVVVCSVKSGGHAIVSAEAAAVAAATTKEWDGLNIGTLVPGALVNARVRHVLSDGLLVSFLTFFTGTIDPFHLGPIKNAADGWKSQFSENQRIKARILFVDPASKRVGLTLQRHLLDWSVLSDFPAQGQIFPAAVVKRVDPNLGLLLDLEAPAAAAAIEENDDDEDDNTDKKIITSSTATNIYGYAHISNLADEKIEKVENRYRPGQVVNVRVIGVRPMDGLVAVSLKSSVLEQSFLNVNDVAPGMKVSGTVVRSEEGMLLIALTSHLKALVPALHMSDLASSKAHKKYKEGQKVGGRVLRVDVQNKKVVVTLKPALVDSKLPVLARVEDAVIGSKYHGVITGVQSYGVFVSFFGDVSGLVPVAECGLPEGQPLQDAFSPGSVVKVRVAGVDMQKNRLKLSLLSKKKAAAVVEVDEGLGGLQPGDQVIGIVTSLHRSKPIDSGAGEGGTGDDWARDFTLGSCVEGQIHGLRDYGTLIDLTANSDVIGIAAPHQSTEGAPTAKGAPVVGVVLECSRKDGIVDVSLRPELVQRAQELIGADTAAALAPPPTKKKKTKKSTSSSKKDDSAVTEHVSPQLGERVSVTVELLKADEGYAVVSLPPGFSPWLGYLATVDFNQPLSVGGGVSGSGGGGALSGSTTILGQIQPGDVITATVAALPSAETHGRLLFGVPPSADPSTTIVSSSTTKNGAAAAGKSTKIRHPAAGSKVNVKIEAVHALHAEVTLDAGFRGRIYITEVVDDDDAASSQEEDKENPLRKLTAGENVDVVVLGKMQSVEGKRHGLLEFSLRPSLLAAATAAAPESNKAPRKPQQLTWESLKPGQTLPGFAQEVEGEHLWVVVSPSIRGRVFLPQSCTTPQQCASASRLFRPGTPLLVTILAVNSGKHSLDVVLGTSVPAAPRPGSLAVGVVVAVAGSGVQIQLAPGHSGRVALTDIHDVSVKNALQGLKPHQFVKVCVLSDKNSGGGGGADGGGRKKSAPLSGSKRKKEGEADDDDDTRSINAAAAPLTSIFSELSLRPSQGGHCAAHTAAKKVSATAVPPPPSAPLPLADLKPGQRVAGYVKSTGAAGVFVCLSRGVDARIKLRQLSDEFVDNPAGMYPAGSYVEGGVLGVEGGRVELTLRKHRPAPSLQNLEEGQVVRGRVKRIEKFGVFVELDAAQDGGAAAPAGPCGLAHLSELADAFVYDPDRLFKVDQREFYGYCFVRGLFGVIINDEFSLCF